MKTIKYLSFFLLFSMLTLSAAAQDAVVIEDGNFIRGTVQGTDYVSVSIKTDDGEVKVFNAKDIKQFLWDGETYYSMPFVIHKQTEFRFFKLLEGGAINLYAMGGHAGPDKQKHRSGGLRVMPSIGLGFGTGGFGSGIGLNFIGGGGGRRDDAPPGPDRHALYYIEKPGFGDMQEITPDPNNSDANYNYIKTTLLDKMADDNDLVNRIQHMDNFDVKAIQSLIRSYNSVHQ